MYDFEKARVKNYYPIHSDPNFLKAQFEDVAKDFSQENAGFMKDRVKAANAILLEDMSSVIDSQISKVARYAGLAPALREFGKLLSYNTGTGNADSVQKALNALNRVERAVVVMFYIEDMPIKKISNVMQIPQGTIKSHLHRAKEKMAKYV